MRAASNRKGKIHRLAPAARARIEQMLDEDRYTLDEIFESVKLEFPDADFSRSGLHRYQPEYTQMRERIREIERVSDALVGGLGEGSADKANRLLAQAVTTAVTHAALKLQTRDDDGEDGVSMQELKDLSLAAGRAMKAQRLAFADIFGLPMRVGRYGPNASQGDIDKLIYAIANLGSDAAAAVPDSVKIEFQQAAQVGGAGDFFDKLVTFWDKQVSKGVIGQTMTADDAGEAASLLPRGADHHAAFSRGDRGI